MQPAPERALGRRAAEDLEVLQQERGRVQQPDLSQLRLCLAFTRPSARSAGRDAFHSLTV